MWTPHYIHRRKGVKALARIYPTPDFDPPDPVACIFVGSGGEPDWLGRFLAEHLTLYVAIVASKARLGEGSKRVTRMSHQLATRLVTRLVLASERTPEIGLGLSYLYAHTDESAQQAADYIYDIVPPDSSPCSGGDFELSVQAPLNGDRSQLVYVWQGKARDYYAQQVDEQASELVKLSAENRNEPRHDESCLTGCLDQTPIEIGAESGASNAGEVTQQN